MLSELYEKYLSLNQNPRSDFSQVWVRFSIRAHALWGTLAGSAPPLQEILQPLKRTHPPAPRDEIYSPFASPTSGTSDRVHEVDATVSLPL